LPSTVGADAAPATLPEGLGDCEPLQLQFFPFPFYKSPRRLRSSRVGGWYHVTSRGNERSAFFRDDRDRLHGCETVGRMVDQFRVVVHGCVLMDNG